MEAKDFRLLVLGSSHVVRLERYIQKLGWKGFWVRAAPVWFLGMSGGRVREEKFIEMVDEFCGGQWKGFFDIVFVILGGNELCDREATAQGVAGDLIKFGEDLVNFYGFKKVIFSEVFYRFECNRYMNDISVDQFNGRVAEINELLGKKLTEHGHISFWKYKYDLRKPGLRDVDGIHFSELFGQEKLIGSLRRAFWYHLQRAKGIQIKQYRYLC